MISTSRAQYAVRRAQTGEAQLLTAIAHAAKRSWGYPDDVIRLWHEDLTVTSDYIDRHEVFVATGGGNIVGFCALTEIAYDKDSEPQLQIDHMWVEPSAMGTGIGGTLLREAKRRASQRGFESVIVFSDPNAEGFYIKAGARRVTTVPSVVAGRVLPVLELDVTI